MTLILVLQLLLLLIRLYKAILIASLKLLLLGLSCIIVMGTVVLNLLVARRGCIKWKTTVFLSWRYLRRLLIKRCPSDWQVILRMPFLLPYFIRFDSFRHGKPRVSHKTGSSGLYQRLLRFLVDHKLRRLLKGTIILRSKVRRSFGWWVRGCFRADQVDLISIMKDSIMA